MIIGLTGGIASGKSTVSQMMGDWEIPVVDADVIAREVVEPGHEAYEKIVQAFGRGVLHDDGTLHRKKLGSIIFNDEEKRKKLNSIVHPAVRGEMKKQRDDLLSAGHPHVVLDIPLLIESELEYLVDRTLLVYVDAGTQLKRLMARDASSEDEARSRINSQMPLDEKKTRVDAVIDNSGTVKETRNELTGVLKSWGIG
ncbi:dephospho-CoA kinase [Bacillus sp. H-16]|uniref:dephospho-CoA kinase n=1 Tax=Alteribacter salitolerans TaxID=2912333 RepID=UPI0019644ABC|nr:dephospho-CoA kinase [Alteribacter salitolerans]MBM7096479.1 dephospho-CoA kinase [Alteribacter salitolerans]